MTKLSSCIYPVLYGLLFLVNQNSYAGDHEKILKVYCGNVPDMDGRISEGEYEDATFFCGTKNWIHECLNDTDSSDLYLKAWVKYAGQSLYFAFDVTDDLIYGINIPRWIPDKDTSVNNFSFSSSPWFGDGIEIYLKPCVNDLTALNNVCGNGQGWQLECSTHKSYLFKLQKGGLIEGNPRNSYAWANYRKWIKQGSMKSVVRMKSGDEGSGYVIEWKIDSDPCLEISPGKFWNPGMGITEMRLNMEVQDLDNKDQGRGNFDNFHHIEVWTGENGNKSNPEFWGRMILYPYFKTK